MPLTIRSTFFPLLGERCWGWPGHIIDTLAVLATIFGLATSLGLGAKQTAAGLEFLLDLPATFNAQIAIIFAVTCLALVSVVRGMDGGVKLLSNINMGVALLLFLFVATLGAGLGLFEQVFATGSAYIGNIIPLSNWIGRDDEAWLHGWTVFYWAWWVSWSPFVGMFIARISRGRTVRQFVVAVLLIPTLVTTLWMAAFGGTALKQVQQGLGSLTEGISDVSLSLFQMLDVLPWASITSFVAIVLVLVFL